MEAPSASETVVEMDMIERRPLIMDRDDVDFETGLGEPPQCWVSPESYGSSHPYPFQNCIAAEFIRTYYFLEREKENADICCFSVF